MAIDITPLKKVINSVVDYKVYNGNHNLTPINYQHGAVVLWLSTTVPISTPTHIRTLEGAQKNVVEYTISYAEYHYQIDILKTVDSRPTISNIPPFEMIAFSIIESLNTSAPMLHRNHDLGLSPIRTRLWLDKLHNKPLHRLTGEFTILARMSVRFKNQLPQVSCINTNHVPIKQSI